MRLAGTTQFGINIVNRQQYLGFSIFLTLFLLFSGAAASAQSAYVRINQLGYITTQPKRAYLMSSGAESGATFTVETTGGSSVFTASVGADKGAWGSFSHVYVLDFDSVSTAGTYKIVVNGSIAATSPNFPIDTGANIYSQALANSLSYYQNSRDGQNFISSPLRTAAGHLHDSTAKVYNEPSYDSNDTLLQDLTATGATIDGSGGWFDAGDYVKFVETHSYVVALQLVGVRDFPNQLGSGSSSSNFTSEARFGLDWLQKMWNDNTQTFYFQVGLGAGNSNIDSDHDIWRLPQADDTYNGTASVDKYIRNRPVFINPNGGVGAKISPNLAGRLAADFAECYQIFKTTDAAYANQCLLSAEHVFDLADTSSSPKITTVTPADFYSETEWRDDMELGAAELYFALQPGNLPGGLPHSDPMFYLTAAAHWAHAYMTGPNDASDTLNLYDVSGLAHYELYRALGIAGNPSGLETTQSAVLADFKKELDNAITQGNTDPYGFGFPWNTDDTASHGGGLSVMASEYTFLTGSTTYKANAPRWLDNILGANGWGSSFIVGDGASFPDCIQHQVANLVGTLNGTQPVLNGAVVEGPNSAGTSGSISGMRACNDSATRYTPFNSKTAVFVDNMQSYNTTEPAIDLSASSFLAFAWLSATPGVASPDFTLAATPATQTITAGSSTTYTVTVTPANGFSANVSLTASGLPSGATASFSPATLSGSGSSTLTVSSTTATAAGTYTVTITGASATLSHTTQASLVINAAPTPDFSLTTSPSSQTVTVGGAASYTSTISALNGFTGTVTLTASGLPTGATATFNPSSVTTSGTSALTISTTSSTPAGTSTITISGTSGSLTHTSQVTLVVNAVAVPDFSISATPASQTVIVGSGTSYTATIGSINGFGGTVSLSASGLPTGATATFTPATVTTSGTSSVAVTTSSSTPTGTFTITITGTSGSTSHGATVTLVVNPVSSLPAGYSDLDIGSPALAGSASYSNGVFSVSGEGADIYGTSDQFHYVYQSVSGDQTVIARVATQQNTNVWAKAGVMIRESTAANSTYVFAMVTPGKGVSMQYRSATGGSAATVLTTAGPVAPYWLMLVRSGNTFTSFTSPDNVTWTKLGSVSVTMATNATAGLAVSSHNTASLSGVTFDNVSQLHPIYQIASGGPAVSPYIADKYFSGGQTDTVTNTITTTGVANPAPTAVYQSERWGGDANSNPAPYSYTIPGLTAGAAYIVRLHFAETFWTASGQRKFNVAINGTTVLTNFDIFATAGGANKVNVQQFTSTANASGNIVISLTVGSADAPKTDGIEILQPH